MSRLARSCRDWYYLMEKCALFDTLLADPDCIYDPSDDNDRLLLGLKATMSEAELHLLRSRMLQARLNKARRGEISYHPSRPCSAIWSPITSPWESVPTAVPIGGNSSGAGPAGPPC